MHTANPSTNKHNQRIKAYRGRLQDQGVKRVEVRIPVQDVPLVHDIANILRIGGDDARTLRKQMHRATGEEKQTTGKDLAAFFHASPLKDTHIDLDRDTATSRIIVF